MLISALLDRVRDRTGDSEPLALQCGWEWAGDQGPVAVEVLSRGWTVEGVAVDLHLELDDQEGGELVGRFVSIYLEEGTLVPVLGGDPLTHAGAAGVLCLSRVRVGQVDDAVSMEADPVGGKRCAACVDVPGTDDGLLVGGLTD